MKYKILKQDALLVHYSWLTKENWIFNRNKIRLFLSLIIDHFDLISSNYYKSSDYFSFIYITVSRSSHVNNI